MKEKQNIPEKAHFITKNDVVDIYKSLCLFQRQVL